jgi:hypothetical protein
MSVKSPWTRICFDKLMEGKHNEIVSNNDDDSMSIEITNNLFHFGENSSTEK